MYESSHPSIVPLKEAARSAEEKAKINYITVHYSRMPRLNTITQSMCAGLRQSSVILSQELLCFSSLFTVRTR